MNIIIPSDINRLSPLFLIWLYIVSNRSMNLLDRKKIIESIHSNSKVVLSVYGGLLRIASSSYNPSFASAADKLLHNSLNVKSIKSIKSTNNFTHEYDSVLYTALTTGTDFSLASVISNLYAYNKKYSVIDSDIRLVMYKIYYTTILHKENSIPKFIKLLETVAILSFCSKPTSGMLYVDEIYENQVVIGIVTDKPTTGLTPLGFKKISNKALVLAELRKRHNNE